MIPLSHKDNIIFDKPSCDTSLVRGRAHSFLMTNIYDRWPQSLDSYDEGPIIFNRSAGAPLILFPTLNSGIDIAVPEIRSFHLTVSTCRQIRASVTSYIKRSLFGSAEIWRPVRHLVIKRIESEDNDDSAA